MIDIKEIKQQIEKINPLILNLSNLVTMDFMANTLLALGASPIMSNDTNDALELYSISDAININIGTLNQDFLTMALAVATKNNKQKPLILDPVGAGSSTIRSQASTDLLPHCTILKGNAGEITALQQSSFQSRGVDSTVDSEDILHHAKALSQQYQIPIVISGAIDYTIFQAYQYQCPFGHKIMSKITGMGCVLTSVIAAFNCAIKDPAYASYTALLFYGLCGELAYQKDPSLAFFQNHFIDIIFSPDYNYIQQKINTLN
ncbi:MAG: hydroxyethylthiazole kinase [Brevinema sp.]